MSDQPPKRPSKQPEADQGPSDWTQEKPSDLILLAGLIRYLQAQPRD